MRRDRHCLDARHYVDEHVFQLERERLYGRLWIFAGFAQALRERHSYFARRVAGVPVLLQNTATGLRAFINQCPHRGMPVQRAGFGARALVCPYHGWSFDGQGALHAIPNEVEYGFEPQERAGLSMIPVALRQVGELLFVNLADDPMPIEQQFAPQMLAALDGLSRHLDHRLIHASFPARCNWKLTMENVKDANHVQFLHAESLFPAMREEHANRAPPLAPGLTPAPRIVRTAAPPLGALSYAVKTPLDIAPGWFAPLVERYGTDNAYYNWFLYPNVNLCSINGLHFVLQQYDPVAPGSSDYHLWIMTARRKHPDTDFTALLRTLMSAERAVVEEDLQHLQALQGAFGPWSPPVSHGNYEQPLIDQHRWYVANVVHEARHDRE